MCDEKTRGEESKEEGRPRRGERGEERGEATGEEREKRRQKTPDDSFLEIGVRVARVVCFEGKSAWQTGSGTKQDTEGGRWKAATGVVSYCFLLCFLLLFPIQHKDGVAPQQEGADAVAPLCLVNHER